MSPDESLQIVQRYTDKGFRGLISCHFFIASRMVFVCNHKIQVFKFSNVILLAMMLLIVIGMKVPNITKHMHLQYENIQKCLFFLAIILTVIPSWFISLCQRLKSFWMDARVNMLLEMMSNWFVWLPQIYILCVLLSLIQSHWNDPQSWIIALIIHRNFLQATFKTSWSTHSCSLELSWSCHLTCIYMWSNFLFLLPLQCDLN